MCIKGRVLYDQNSLSVLIFQRILAIRRKKREDLSPRQKTNGSEVEERLEIVLPNTPSFIPRNLYIS